ncbi:MAG TPA: hypothetical protein PK438_05840 [Clostridia bacterium]|nr:MAG: hypothetical protein BWY35_01367 [Firmicutes bacterium ADurb.Bin248]HOG01979.1 hypothetical protein [Clostridia bacterium]HOS18790.1 hypothetical protein [Clostridia bacterium]HPK15639.1 hypothetical protein [Clostridia bacterium]
MDYLNENELEKISGDTGRALAAQRKVTLVISGAGDGAPWEGGLNGYFFRIRRGVPVEVPEAIADLIRENEQTTELSREALGEYRRGRGKKLSA